MMKDYEVPEIFEAYEAIAYAKDVVSGKIIAGKYIILECARFLKDLKRSEEDEDFEWYFDTKMYELIIKFQGFFKFADGVNAGKPMKLAKFQCWILANIFCWKHKAEHYVRFSRIYIQVSRKQGKSFLLGMILLIKGLITEYGQFATVATKKDQAEIVIKEIKKLLDCSIEEVKNRYKIYGKAKITKIVCEHSQAEIFPLSSDANTLDGLGIDTCVCDEFGAHPNYELYEVMRSSQVYKPNSQICIITTAYPNLNTSPAYKERCMLIDMYEGKSPIDERYFSCIYELDEGDDYSEKKNWVKSNPLFVEFPVIMEKLENDYNNAIKDPQKLTLFLTKNLNCWLANDALTAYMDYNEWLRAQEGEVDFDGKEVVVGVDMSKSTDLCGVSIVAKDEENYIVKSKAFLPEEFINMKEVSDKLPYTSYAQNEKGWLTATEGKFVNQVEVENYIRSIEDRFNCKIKSIAFDSWGALGMMSSLAQDYDVVDVKMTYKNFSPAIKRFRELVYEGRVLHEYNPILNFCVANAITKADLQENILLDKKRSSNRIDLLVSTIIAYSEFFEEENEEGYGYFLV